MKSFLLMLAFMTRIPIKINFDYEENDFRRGILYIPVIGLSLGLFLYGVYALLEGVFSSLVLSFIIVILYLLITGGLHIDGLADTLDALGSNRPRERMLEILRDSHIGTFGVLGIIVWFAGMVILMNEIPKACLILPVAARTMALFSCSISSYAREKGLGGAVVDGTKAGHVLFSLFLSIVAFVLLLLFSKDSVLLVSSAVGYILVFIFTLVSTRSISKKLSGITGDVIGYIIESTGLLFLLFTYAVTVIAGMI